MSFSLLNVAPLYIAGQTLKTWLKLKVYLKYIYVFTFNESGAKPKLYFYVIIYASVKWFKNVLDF